jgi:hypothetical protein
MRISLNVLLIQSTPNENSEKFMQLNMNVILLVCSGSFILISDGGTMWCHMNYGEVGSGPT